VAQSEGEPIEGITTCDNPLSPMSLMDWIRIYGAMMPIIKELSYWLMSSRGLDNSRDGQNNAIIGAPDSGRDLQVGRNSGNLPRGAR
jgi:hypothetical protein